MPGYASAGIKPFAITSDSIEHLNLKSASAVIAIKPDRHLLHDSNGRVCEHEKSLRPTIVIHAECCLLRAYDNCIRHTDG